MNFALILFVLLLISGLLWVLDTFWLKKTRRRSDRNPWWVEYGASFFPVILIVFGLRSFIVEPFKIPSGSMIPTLEIGDFILVNKFTYGIRLPVINKKIIDINKPQRGDVMVFRYPEDPSLDYIKRVVGVGGDTVSYQNKRLSINGQPVEHIQQADYFDENRLYYSEQYSEKLGETSFNTLNDRDAPSAVTFVTQFAGRENCQYNAQGFICKVPDGQFFVMGDNRDNSRDSRVWGFVPEENIVGKAFFIWLNTSEPSRIGRFH